MPSKAGKGMYEVGLIRKHEGRVIELYGVATGKALNNAGGYSFGMIDYLPESKWFTYRLGPIDKPKDKDCCYILDKFDSKKEAVKSLERGRNLDEYF